MRVLVTGASGFLGSHVSDQLAAAGQELRLLLRPTSSTEFIQGFTYERANGDIRDAAALDAAVQGIDCVVHLAGLTSSLKESQYTEVNRRGTERILHAAVEAGVSKFVYVSSLAAQGPSLDGSMPDPQTSRPQPICAYGRSKLAGEYAALALKGRMQVVILRPPSVYGPRDRDFLTFFRLVDRWRVMPYYGDGLNRVSWINVLDCAAAIVAATLNETESGAVYTMADGEPHTWRELVEALATSLGKRPLGLYLPPQLFKVAGAVSGVAGSALGRTLNLTPEKVMQMSQRYWICDNQRINADLGWTPHFNAQDGIAATVKWYRQEGWL